MEDRNLIWVNGSLCPAPSLQKRHCWAGDFLGFPWEQLGGEGWGRGPGTGALTLGGEEDPLGVVGQAQPGGRLGVGEQLHPLHELLPPGKPAHTEKLSGVTRTPPSISTVRAREAAHT